MKNNMIRLSAKISAVLLLFSIIVFWEVHTFGQDSSKTQKDVWGKEVVKKGGVIISFRGGNIDDNLLKLYNYLYTIDRLLVRCLTVPRGLTLEETLVNQKVLFKYYPDDFDKLLVELNRQNRDVKIRTKKGTSKEILIYQPNSKIIVPNIHFEMYEYLTAIELSGTPLAAAARKKNLIWGYAPNSKALQLVANGEKKKKLVTLNSEYAGTDITAVKKGRVIFPADGFRARVPLTPQEIKANACDPQWQELLNENVYIKQGMRPYFNSYSNNESSQQIASASSEYVYKCIDPLDSHLENHLNAIKYYFPESLRERRIIPSAAVVIDCFPPLSERKKHCLEYRKCFKKFLENDGIIDQDEKSLLECRGKNIGLPSEMRDAQERKVRSGETSVLAYPVSDHPEFQEVEKINFQAEIVDPKKYDKRSDHGFHVASIIGAHCNRFGISGINPNAFILAYDLNSIDLITILSDVTYTLNCKDKPCLINASWNYEKGRTDPEFTRQIKDLSKEYLVVCAAGDRLCEGPTGETVGGPLEQPCSLVPGCLGERPNVLTVTSCISDDSNRLDRLANYTGKDNDIVSLAAPGCEVLGACKGNRFHKLSGTSQATAFVTGTLSLLQAQCPELSPKQLKNRILYTADLHVPYYEKVRFGRLNMERTLKYPNKDIVYYLGSLQPLLGIFDYNKPGSWNKNRPLHLYVKGDINKHIEDCKVSNVRRISVNLNTGYYTVVYYKTKECKRLKIVRDVSFYPTGEEGWIEDKRLTKSFRLITADDKTIDMDLKKVRELIVRADAGRR